MKDERNSSQKLNDDKANKQRNYNEMEAHKRVEPSIAFNRKPFYLKKETTK